MFGSETLDIAIGLVLVFLLVSLMLTALTEAIEHIFKTRAADLERALGLMLSKTQKPDTPEENSADVAADISNAVQNFYQQPLIDTLFKGSYTSRKASRFLRESGRNLPSYIPRDIFSTTALNMVWDATPETTLAKVIAALKTRYPNDTARVQAQLESWYDGVMDRAAGWYKRRTQKLLFWLGLITAIALNINPFAIAQYLAETPKARDQMVAMATRMIEESEEEASPAQNEAEEEDEAGKNGDEAANGKADAKAADEVAADAGVADAAAPPNPEATAASPAVTLATKTPNPIASPDAAEQAKTEQAKLAETAKEADRRKEDLAEAVKLRPACVPAASKEPVKRDDLIRCHQALAEVGLPIGWSDFTLQRTFPLDEKSKKLKGGEAFCAWAWALIIALLGWAITGLAATLGAPFWFDALNKIMVIRATVKPKEKSGDESSEDRNTPKTPPAGNGAGNAAPAGGAGNLAPAANPKKT